MLDDAGSPHGYGRDSFCCACMLCMNFAGVLDAASFASCDSGSARDAVTGASMLHKAVAAMMKADVKGMDVLEPGVLLAPHCQAGHAHGGKHCARCQRLRPAA